jgi:hypothetical protein
VWRSFELVNLRSRSNGADVNGALWHSFKLLNQQAHQQSGVADGRSPDTRDFAALAHSPVVTVFESPGFDWGDFGIGIGAAFGAVLIVLCSIKLLSGRPSRKQAGPVATA